MCNLLQTPPFTISNPADGSRGIVNVQPSNTNNTHRSNFPNNVKMKIDSFTSEMYGHTFFYSGHETEVTRELLEVEGFEIEFWEVEDPSSQGHIAIVARKKA